MGGAVSSGRDNNELIDNLVNGNYIRTREVERVFRALDRADYMTREARDQAYKDLAWRHGPLHLSAPCIYSEVMEGLELSPGLSFLNVGSGTGYLSTLVGLILGSSGISHGVELHPAVVDYANRRLGQFIENSPVLDEFDFCEPKYFCGNGLCIAPLQAPYDRVYCGAACPEEYENYFKQLIKIGGILVMPLNENLVQVKRLSDTEWTSRSLLNVSFMGLRVPEKREAAELVRLEEQCPVRLQTLCRGAVRRALRGGVWRRHPELRAPPPCAPPAKRPRPRRIMIPIEDDSDVGLNALHDLDRGGGAGEMNALLSLVLSMGSRVAGSLRFDAPGSDPENEEPANAAQPNPEAGTANGAQPNPEVAANADAGTSNADRGGPNVDTGEPKADTAQPKADTAQPKADTAQPNADATLSNGDAAMENDDAAAANGDATQTKADTAQPTADTAQPKADTVQPNTDATLSNGDAAMANDDAAAANRDAAAANGDSAAANGDAAVANGDKTPTNANRPPTAEQADSDRAEATDDRTESDERGEADQSECGDLSRGERSDREQNEERDRVIRDIEARWNRARQRNERLREAMGHRGRNRRDREDRDRSDRSDRSDDGERRGRVACRGMLTFELRGTHRRGHGTSNELSDTERRTSHSVAAHGDWREVLALGLAEQRGEEPAAEPSRPFVRLRRAPIQYHRAGDGGEGSGAGGGRPRGEGDEVEIYLGKVANGEATTSREMDWDAEDEEEVEEEEELDEEVEEEEEEEEEDEEEEEAEIVPQTTDVKAEDKPRQKLDSGLGETTPSADSSPASTGYDAGSSRRSGQDSDRPERRSGHRRRQKRLASRLSTDSGGSGSSNSSDSCSRRRPKRRAGDGGDARRVRLSILMKRSIKELPLPFALKKYVNLGRCFEF